MRALLKVILFCSIVSLAIRGNAQQRRLDSLWNIYNNKEQSDTNRLNAIESITKGYLDVNEDSVVMFGEKQIVLAQETKHEKYAANAYLFLGYSFYMRDKRTKALEYFLKALAIYTSLNSNSKISKCYTFIGLIYFKQSNYPQTLNYYFKSLKIDEGMGNKEGMAISYSNIALIYDRLSNLSKALEYDLKALKINEELGNKSRVAANLLNAGIIYDKLSKKNMALSNYLKALKIFEEEGNEQDISLCLTNIGILYFDQSNYPLALDYYTRALEINERLGNKVEMATSFLKIGDLYNKTGNYKLAEINYEKSRALSTEADDLDVLRLSYEGLSAVNKNTNNYKSAFENHKKFKQLTDSIFNLENIKQISDLKTNFEVEKIETELKAKAEALAIIATEEKKRQQFIIFGVIVILVIVLCFSFFLYKRYRLTNQQKEIIEIKSKETEAQKALIEEHQKETIDSITYAKRIQYALLANKELLQKHLPKTFVIFNPKDIVSGDFYWAAEYNGKFYLAVCDSTGHGVPGAFMSLLNIGFLNEAIKEKDISQPHEVLNFVRKRLMESIGNDGQQDGMDAILICIEMNRNEKKLKTITYSAANNVPVLVRNNQAIELEKDKMPVGKGEKTESFSLHQIDLEEGDNLFLYTDGYADQFGGPKVRSDKQLFGQGKKFKHKQLQELLLQASTLVPEKQKELLDRKFRDWKGDLEQVDDVCLIGIKI